MMEERSLSESASYRGKTIENIVHTPDWAQWAILFSDGTFALLTARKDYDGGAYISPDTRLLWAYWPRSTLLSAGIFEEAELDRFEAADRKRRQAERDDAERATYERLRARFEPREAGPIETGGFEPGQRRREMAEYRRLREKLGPLEEADES